MHWMMWVFWGSFAALFAGGYLVDVLTKGKYKFNTHEKTLNQNLAEADAKRHTGRSDNQNGTF